MRQAFLVVFIFFSITSRSQHCPWDCAGMILIKTDAPARDLRIMNPVLVEDSSWLYKANNIVVDSNYGTGSYDTCFLKSFEDFMIDRTAKISKDHQYAYDTVYHFARGYYLIKFNWCKYKGKKMFIHFYDRHSRGLTDRFIRVPEANRIHLHDLSSAIHDGKTAVIDEAIRDKILHVSCTAWTFYESDCK